MNDNNICYKNRERFLEEAKQYFTSNKERLQEKARSNI